MQPSAGGFVPQHCQLDQQLGQQLEVGGTTAAQNQPSPAGTDICRNSKIHHMEPVQLEEMKGECR